MSDGVPKSRVTLVYDTKQPEGREKPRELPFRLLVLGDVGGDKSAPLDQRKVRQLNGRNLGEVIKGLKVAVRDIDLGDAPASGASTTPGGSATGGSATGATAGTAGTAASGTAGTTAGTSTGGAASSTAGASSGSSTSKPRPKATVLIDSMSSFSPDDVLRLLTGQKATAASVDPLLSSAWGSEKSPKELWPGDEALTQRWAQREQVVGFQKSYQNSKTLRAALKRFSAPPADAAETQARKDAIAKLKKELATAIAAQPKPTT